MTASQPVDAPVPAPQQPRTGEINTMPQLLDDLKAVENEALNELDNARVAAIDADAELDDAQRDDARAKEDAHRVELMVGSTRQLLPQADAVIEALVALADTNASRVQSAATRASLAESAKNLAGGRATAAESRAQAAVTAHRGILARHQAVQEAVRDANATGGAADKKFHVPA